MSVKDLVPPAAWTAKEELVKRRALNTAREQLVGADKLNLGCGPTVLDGWANIDLEPRPGVIGLNITWGLPVAASTIEVAFIEHMLEEIEQGEAMALLQDILRALKPGGILRVSTPDLGALVEEYVSGRIDYWAPVGWTPENPCDMVNEGMRFWGNQYVYDKPQLEAFVLSAGFSEVRFVEWHESEHPDLRGLETRPYRRELIIEAIK